MITAREECVDQKTGQANLLCPFCMHSIIVTVETSILSCPMQQLKWTYVHRFLIWDNKQFSVAAV